MHPIYGEVTERITQHTLSFPPGSPDFREALKDGKGLLDHVASVYQPSLPPSTSPSEVPGNWQTVTTTHGELSSDHRSTSAALPPATQAAINAQAKIEDRHLELQPLESTEDDWTASSRQEVFADYLRCGCEN